MKKNNKKLLLLLLIFPLAFLAKANNERSEAPLQGYVTDAVTKKPVSGVVVSASAPGAIVSREVTTDADGYFSFVQLPLTQLTLQFDKKGYQPCKKAGVVIKEKTSLKINIEFLQEDAQADNGDSEYPLLRMLHMN